MLKVVGVGYCDSYETVGPSFSLDTPPHESNLLVSDQLTIKPDTVPSCRSARRSGLRRSTAVTNDQHKELPLLIRQRGTHGLSRLHKSKASPTSALHRAPLQRIPLSSSAINLSGDLCLGLQTEARPLCGEGIASPACLAIGIIGRCNGVVAFWLKVASSSLAAVTFVHRSCDPDNASRSARCTCVNFDLVSAKSRGAEPLCERLARRR